MDRHECSYFLKVTGDLDSVATLMGDAGIVPDYLVPDTDAEEDGCLRYRVDDALGTIAEWRDADELLGAVAAGAPDAVFELMEHDEEDKSSSRYVRWENGQLAKTRYGRTIDADVLYDEETLRAACDILHEANLPAVAKLLKDRMGPHAG